MHPAIPGPGGAPARLVYLAVRQAVVECGPALDQFALVLLHAVHHPLPVQLAEDGEHVQGAIAGRVVAQVIVDQLVGAGPVIVVEHQFGIGLGKGVDVFGEKAAGEVYPGRIDDPGVQQQEGLDVTDQGQRRVVRDGRVDMQAEGVDKGVLRAFGAQPGKRLDEGVQFVQLVEGYRLGHHLAGNQDAAGVVDIGLDVMGEAAGGEFHAQGLEPAAIAHGLQQVGVTLDLEPAHAGLQQHRLEGAEDFQLAAKGLVQRPGGMGDGQVAELELEPGLAWLAGFASEARRQPVLLGHGSAPVRALVYSIR